MAEPESQHSNGGDMVPEGDNSTSCQNLTPIESQFRGQDSNQTEHKSPLTNVHTHSDPRKDQDNDVLVTGEGVSFEYDKESETGTSNNKKKKKKKKKKKTIKHQTDQHVIAHDMNLDDPDLEYPDSRILKQDVNGDVIVQPLNSSTIPPTSSSSNESEKSGRRASSSKGVNSLIPQDPFQLNEELRNYWLSMPLSEKKRLLDLERESVFTIMKDQQRVTCNCSVCGKKREIIEQELKKLYEEYSHSIETQNSITHSLFDVQRPNSALNPSKNSTTMHNQQDHHIQNQQMNHKHNHPLPCESHNIPQPPLVEHNGQHHNEASQFKIKIDPSVKEKTTGLMSVAEDLLHNDGKKFLEMMEKLAESRIQRGQNLKQSSSNHSNVINNNQIDEEENPNYMNHGEDDEYYENNYLFKGTISDDTTPNALVRDFMIPPKVPLEALCNEPNYKEDDDPDYIYSGSEDSQSDEDYPDSEEEEVAELYQELDWLKEDLSRPLATLGGKSVSEFQSEIERAVKILASGNYQVNREELMSSAHSLLYGTLQQEFDKEMKEEFKDVFQLEDNVSAAQQQVSESLFRSTTDELEGNFRQLAVDPEVDNSEPLFDIHDESNSCDEHENSIEDDEEAEDEAEEEDEEEDQEDGDFEDNDNDNELEGPEPEAINEEQQLQEGRAMLQLCTAKMLRQSLLELYKKKKHEEYLQSFLEELENENEQQKATRAKKQREKEKKKEKKRQLQAQKEKERLAKIAEEERIKKEKEEESRKKQEARRQRKLEEERRKAEEKLLREEAMERNRKAKEEKRKVLEEAKRVEEAKRLAKELEEKIAKEEEERRIAEEKRIIEEQARLKEAEEIRAEEQRLKELRRKEELISKSPFIQHRAAPVSTKSIPSTTSPTPFYQTHLATSTNHSNLFNDSGAKSTWGNGPALDSHSNNLIDNFGNATNGNTSIFNNHEIFGNVPINRQVTPDIDYCSSSSSHANTTSIDFINNGLSNMNYEAASQVSTPNHNNIDQLDPFGTQRSAIMYGTSNLWNNNENNWNLAGGSSGLWNSSTSLNHSTLSNPQPNMFSPMQNAQPMQQPISAQSKTSNNSQLHDIINSYQLSIRDTYFKWNQYQAEGGFITLEQLWSIWRNETPLYQDVNRELFRSILENKNGSVEFELLNDANKSPFSFVRIRQVMTFPPSQMNPVTTVHAPPLNGSETMERRSSSNYTPWNNGF